MKNDFVVFGLGETEYQFSDKKLSVEYVVLLRSNSQPKIYKSTLGLQKGQFLNGEKLFFDEKGRIAEIL